MMCLGESQVAPAPGDSIATAHVDHNQADAKAEVAEMKLADAEALLAELAAVTREAQIEVGTTGRPRREYAYVKLTSPSDPETYAIVSTPGIGWYELEVSGDFHTGRADDLASDKDVREYIEHYLQAATAYLDGRWSTHKSRFLRSPTVTIQTNDGPVNLARTGRWSTNRR